MPDPARKPETQAERHSFAERGGYWVVAQNVLTLGIIMLGAVFRRQWPTGVSVWAGLILCGIAAWLGIAGVLALGRNRTPYPCPVPDAQLVRHGVYRWVRHPLYASLMFAGFGWTLLWQSWPALCATLALAVLVDRKARMEERWLSAHFPEYIPYARTVRRFLPGLN